jgi:arylsulfatase A-like enzyme
LLSVVAGGAACSGGKPASVAAPDVVLVVVDALRADRVRHALDGGTPALPHLARLAQDAVVYERASSPATWCIPAHASLLTGRWPSFHGAERHLRGGALEIDPIDADVTTLAEVLRARGLRTAAFVPGRGDLAAPYGFDRGFDDFVNDPTLRAPARMGDAVGQWLDAQSGPVFLFVSLDGLRQGKDPGETGGGSRRLVDRSELTNLAAHGGTLDAAPRDAMVAEYDAALAEIDGAVGDLLALLQASGRYAGALVVITADHGELLGEHGLAGHGWPPFEDGLNVPLIVKYPDGRAGGERVDRRVSTLGVFATIVDTVGATAPDGIQARPLDDHHPVWAEDVDRKGRRVRAGYDGLREKIIRVTGDGIDVACVYDMYTDAAEIRPNCGAIGDEPLTRAMASFSSKPRPGAPPAGLARAGKSHLPGDSPARATN